jgi:hypothetical protein
LVLQVGEVDRRGFEGRDQRLRLVISDGAEGDVRSADADLVPRDQAAPAQQPLAVQVRAV